MRRVDFSTEISIIIENCRENMHISKNRERAFTQTDLITGIFSEYYDSCDDKIFESSSISRWIKGSRPVPADLINFYRDNGCESIGYDFQDNCVDVAYDLNNLYNELVTLVSSDYSLSEEKKNEIMIDIDATDESEVCRFIGTVIFAAIDRPFIPADKAMLPASAITVAECIFGSEVPAPCRYFCGRDTELDELNTALQEHSKVFISGFAGIGKSEFAKAYAKKFKKEYYSHIRSLFSLYLLDDDYQNIMRNMVFFDEVRIRYFAKILELTDTNGINELCELGFIENIHADIITLHPMIRDIVLLDLKPTFDNCNALITNLKSKLQIIGYELPDSATIISAVRNVMKYIGNTDSNSYLNFLESAYIFLDNYHEYSLMESIISETEKLLSDKTLGTVNDRALLLNNKAMLPMNRNEKLAKSISMMNKALSMCDNKANPVLFANINMNLGLLYTENKEPERGLEFMDKAYLFIKLTRAYNDDFITIARNYAATLSENSRVTKAIEVLKECEFATEECCSNNHAALLYDLGAAYILSGNYPLAVKKYNLAFTEYSALGCTDELTARKIAAARQIQRYGYEYPKEWEFDYLE